LFPVKI